MLTCSSRRLTQSGILSIPDEVWLSHFPIEGCESILMNLALTNRSLHTVFNELLYRHIVLDFSGHGDGDYEERVICGTKRLSCFMRTMLAVEGLGKLTRNLTLDMQRLRVKLNLNIVFEDVSPTSEPLLLLAQEVCAHRGFDTNFLYQSLIRQKILTAMPNIEALQIINAGREFYSQYASYSEIPMSLDNLKSLELHGRFQNTCVITDLLYIKTLEYLDLVLYPDETRGVPPSRFELVEHTALKELRLHIQSPSWLQVATDILPYLQGLEIVRLTIDTNSQVDSANALVANIPAKIKSLVLAMNHQCIIAGEGEDAAQLDFKLRRFENLRELTVQLELLLGTEACKHQRKRYESTTIDPALLADLLPTQLQHLRILVADDHTMRNGDDYFVRILCHRLQNPQCLPNLKTLSLFPHAIRSRIELCGYCRTSNAQLRLYPRNTKSLAICRHESFNLRCLAAAQGLTIHGVNDVGVLYDADYERMRARLTKSVKINARRSWYDPDIHEDLGLFGLFLRAEYEDSCFSRAVPDEQEEDEMTEEVDFDDGVTLDSYY